MPSNRGLGFFGYFFLYFFGVRLAVSQSVGAVRRAHIIVSQSVRRSVREHTGQSVSRAVGRLVHAPSARQSVGQSARQCLRYDEPESPHEGGAFKILVVDRNMRGLG